MPELTQSRVKYLFDYNPESGDLIRKVRAGNNVKVGDIAGSPHSAGYLLVMVDKKRYLIHRIIWLYVYGHFPPDQIDHINQCRTDNRLANLRNVTPQENQHNKSMYSNNKSGFVGVSWHKCTKKWMAYISADGRRKNLGVFTNKADAISARQEANAECCYHENHGL